MVPSEPEVRSIIENLYAQSFHRDGIEHREPIASVDDKFVEALCLLGVEINTDYVHSISDTQIGHAVDNHSSESEEAKLNQIPISKDDLLLIPFVIKDYDKVEVSPNKNKRGLTTIILTKQIDDCVIYYLEEVRVRRKSLAMVTLYKKNVTADYSAN